MFERFDTTPRLAFMSAEKESGKSRALEVTSVQPSRHSLPATGSCVRVVGSSQRCALLHPTRRAQGKRLARLHEIGVSVLRSAN